MTALGLEKSGTVLCDSDKRALLGQLDLFEKLRAAELDRLVTYTRWRRTKGNEVLFRKDDPGTSMMVVESGRVKVCTHSEDGRELVLNLFRRGEVFGEIALLDGAPRSADAVTLEPCQLLILDRRDFIPFLLDHPEAAVRMIEVVALKLRRTTAFLEDLAFREGSSRLARRIVYLAECFGVPVDGGIKLELSLSQQQIGNMASMTRESINKQLKQWREEGLITWERGYYTITDIEALRAL